jgi:hypothetical protein
MVPTNVIVIDAAYQRELDERWIRSRARRFDYDLFDPLSVSLRADGSHAAIDGQGRLELAMRVGLTEVPCVVYEGLTPEQESTLFRKFQSERRALKPFDEFKAALFEGLEWAVGCKETAERYGFTIAAAGDKEQTKVISGVRALQRVFIEGPKVLDLTLMFISEGWAEGVKQRTDASVIEGLGAFVQKHLIVAEKLDQARLIRIFRGDGYAEALTPEMIRFRAAKERAASAGKGVSADGMFSRRWSVLTVLEKAYNESLSKDDIATGRLRYSRRPSRVRAKAAA